MKSLGKEIKVTTKYLPQFRCTYVCRDEFGNEEGTMWLALASIVLASAIAFNVIALWLTGWFERKQPEGLLSERNTNAELSPHWTAAEGL